MEARNGRLLHKHVGYLLQNENEAFDKDYQPDQARRILASTGARDAAEKILRPVARPEKSEFLVRRSFVCGCNPCRRIPHVFVLTPLKRDWGHRTYGI
jgi:hypothetical protein